MESKNTIKRDLNQLSIIDSVKIYQLKMAVIPLLPNW